MAFTEQQIQEIKTIILATMKSKGLNWKIVQTLPELPEKNTLYFHQVSLNPVRFDIYNTDKDGDLAISNTYSIDSVDQLIETLDAKITELEAYSLVGITGEATQGGTPTGGEGVRRYIVNTPITAPNNWNNLTVTLDELNANTVYFLVIQGVITKDLKPNIVGKSAYDIAVLNDFVGTEEEWLESNRLTNLSMSKWDVIVDKNGWALSYSLQAADLYSMVNEKTQKIIVGLYDLEVDENGNVRKFYKSWEPEAPETVQTLKDAFATASTVVIGSDGYVAFPAIAIGKTGIIHVMYRKGAGHVAIDGTIYYTYSTDFGKTWSSPVVLLQGGTQSGSWYQDYRDCRLLRMSNGKYLFGTFSLQVKPEVGQPFDMAVNTDPTSRKVHSVILEEDSDGILNIAGKTVVNHPLTQRFTGGGLKEHDHVVYQMCYTEVSTNVYDAFLTKSLDFGLTWSDVATVQTGCSESSIDFIGETMYCLLRPSTLPTSVLKKSTDYGVTWTLVSEIDTYHGLDIKAVGDNLLVSGRRPPNFTTVDLFNTFGESLIQPIEFNGEVLDSGYSQICFFEQYIFIVYYNVLGGRVLIQLTNIEKSKLLNI